MQSSETATEQGDLLRAVGCRPASYLPLAGRELSSPNLVLINSGGWGGANPGDYRMLLLWDTHSVVLSKPGGGGTGDEGLFVPWNRNRDSGGLGFWNQPESHWAPSPARSLGDGNPPYCRAGTFPALLSSLTHRVRPRAPSSDSTFFSQPSLPCALWARPAPLGFHLALRPPPLQSERFASHL